VTIIEVFYVISPDCQPMRDHHLTHRVNRSIEIEVPDAVAAEVAVRTSPDASRSEVRDLLRDHVAHQHEYVTADGRNVIDVILDSDERE
jgi:Arc/MetJ family transcription regulator